MSATSPCPPRDSEPPILPASPAPVLALPAPAVDQSSTVKAVRDDYKVKHLEATAKAATIRRFVGLFEKHVLPGWRDRGL